MEGGPNRTTAALDSQPDTLTSPRALEIANVHVNVYRSPPIARVLLEPRNFKRVLDEALGRCVLSCSPVLAGACGEAKADFSHGLIASRRMFLVPSRTRTANSPCSQSQIGQLPPASESKFWPDKGAWLSTG